MPQVQYIRNIVTSSQTNPQLGVLPRGATVIDAIIHCTELFDSDGTDNISIGYDGDPDAYITNKDVSSTGRFSLSEGTLAAGSGLGYDDTARNGVDATYVNGGSPASTGKAHIIIIYVLLPIGL